jgi:hypothetical protein
VTAGAFIPDDYDGLARHVGFLSRASFFRNLSVFKGQDVTFTVTVREKSISSQQRRWLRGGFLDQVEAHLIDLGNAPETIDRNSLHYDFLSIRFGTVAQTSKIPGGSPRIVPTRTSSDLTVREVCDYIEWLARYCAEHMELVIELPDEWRARTQPQPAHRHVGAA